VALVLVLPIKALSPDGMKNHLKKTSEVLLKLYNDQQGAGLVRADLAIQ